MKLISVYIVLVLVGVLIAYCAGLAAEIVAKDFAIADVSLFVFLGLFFISLWAGWRLALRLT